MVVHNRVLPKHIMTKETSRISHYCEVSASKADNQENYKISNSIKEIITSRNLISFERRLLKRQSRGTHRHMMHNKKKKQAQTRQTSRYREKKRKKNTKHKKKLHIKWTTRNQIIFNILILKRTVLLLALFHHRCSIRIIRIDIKHL